jgi:hypothetical protein
MVFKRKSNGSGDYMERHEAVIWLGRSMSTHEVSIRMVLQLLDAITLQQRVIQALYEHAQGIAQSEASADALEQMDLGLTSDLSKRLEEVRREFGPILDMVDQSCKTLEGML